MRMTDLTDAECGVVLAALRQQLRHEERKQAALYARFGDSARVQPGKERITLLESTYRKLGGDPARITNRRAKEQS